MKIDSVYQLSETQVIDELNSLGVRVINKPVALMPSNIYDAGSYTHGVQEVDIYDALQRFRNMSKMPDPFSKV